MLTAHPNSPNGLTRVNAMDLLSQLCIFAQQELRTVPASIVAAAASRDLLAALRAGLLTQAVRALKVDTGLSKDRAAGILIMLAQWLVNNPVRFSRSPSHMCTEYVCSWWHICLLMISVSARVARVQPRAMHSGCWE